MTIKQEIATDLIKRFPRHGNHTLAKIAFRENPTVFTTYESARKCVQTLRGNNGKKMRHLANPAFTRPCKMATDPFARIPAGKPQFETEWAPIALSGASKNLILCDIHFPFHDRSALILALRYAQDRGITRAILNGDITDFFSVSDFVRDPRLRNLKNEIETTREFLATLRQMFPKIEIIFKLGNHEERWERYLIVKAPELIGIEDFEIEKVLQFANYGVGVVNDKRPIRLGKLNVIHGHEYKSAFTDPVNPARSYFLRAKVHCIGGDKHRTSQHSENTLESKVISTWSIGCLCDLHPKYQPLNNWNHGFALVEVDKGGAFLVNNLKIIDGKVY